MHRLRKARLILLATSVATAVLVLAPAALAKTSGGQGLYGETTDQVVTNAGFIIIAFFPVLALVLSLIQWRLEKRKDARLAAKRSRSSSADWHGGW